MKNKMKSEKTLKDFTRFMPTKDYEGTICPINLKQEAIKWVKEDMELLFHDGERGEHEKILRDLMVRRWMKRLNITEEDLK